MLVLWQRQGMTFEELLTLLLGWVGRRVRVAVATAGEPPVTVALIGGVLAGGEDPSDDGMGAVAFSFAGTEAGSSWRGRRSRARAGANENGRRSSCAWASLAVDGATGELARGHRAAMGTQRRTKATTDTRIHVMPWARSECTPTKRAVGRSRSDRTAREA